MAFIEGKDAPKGLWDASGGGVSFVLWRGYEMGEEKSFQQFGNVVLGKIVDFSCSRAISAQRIRHSRSGFATISKRSSLLAESGLVSRKQLTMMHALLYIPLGLAVLGILTSTVFVGMVLVAAVRFRRHANAEIAAPTLDPLPPVSILKPLHGAPSYLAECLEGYFKLDYPEYELIFCARHADDKGLAMAAEMAKQYPSIPVTILHSGEPPWQNARCYSMHLMAEAAKHDLMVLTDADVPVTPGYLKEMVKPFGDPAVGASTCIYRGKAVDPGFGERLEALGMSVEMSSGVIVSDMIEEICFTLGPSAAVRKSAINAAGGFAAFGNHAADDFMLGWKVFESGRKVALSHHLVDHIILKSSFVKTLEHQLSWMRSTRFSRPAGHFGTGTTFSLPFGILALIGGYVAGQMPIGVALFFFTVLVKFLQALVVSSVVVGSDAAVMDSWLYPLRDLMGFGFWVQSYLSNRLPWHGKIFILEPGGTMHLEEKKAQRG